MWINIKVCYLRHIPNPGSPHHSHSNTSHSRDHIVLHLGTCHKPVCNLGQTYLCHILFPLKIINVHIQWNKYRYTCICRKKNLIACNRWSTLHRYYNMFTFYTFRLFPSSLTSTITCSCCSVASPRNSTVVAAQLNTVRSIITIWTHCWMRGQ